MLRKNIDPELFRINFDPRKPQKEFFEKASDAEAATERSPIPKAVPWATGFAPAAKPISKGLGPQALPKADYVIVTWTQAEALMLANLMTPGVSLDDWSLYDHNFASTFLNKITDERAPALDQKSKYFHKLGAFCPASVGDATVLCFKSNLHLATDGPALPLLLLWKQIIEEAQPRLIITTGTAGAVGSNMRLGDAIIAGTTRFDCTRDFKSRNFAQSAFQCSRVSGLQTYLNDSLLSANSSRLEPERAGIPQIYFPGSAIANPVIVTTDRFAFDNTTNSNGLQSLGNMCEMDDATLGLARQQFGFATDWIAVRNASDPQIDGSLPPAEQSHQANEIYTKYGYWTTISSVVASWACICASEAERKQQLQMRLLVTNR